MWGAAVGAGVTVGPLAGAGLATAVGWRPGFWLEAAAAGAVMTAAATLTESSNTARARLDLAGVTTLGAAMTFLIAGLVETRHGWSAGTTFALSAALVIAAFAAVELRSRRPMLDPICFPNRGFSPRSAARSLPSRLEARTRLLIGLALAAVGELALTGLSCGAGWMRLVAGPFVTGLGTGVVNAALGKIAVESVPPGRVGWAAARITRRATWAGRRVPH